jgi:ankyrin repeat protein
VGESNPLKKLQHTVEGKYKFDGCCAMNTDPLLRDNNGKQMRFHSQTETIDSLLDRMEKKYSADAEKPKDMRTDEEKNEGIIMDLRIWNGNVQLKTPPCFCTVWAEKPLREFLLLHYSARDRLDFYEQLRQSIEESSGKVTMYDNEQYSALNNAIPTVDDLASYLFTFVALQPEQLTLAKSVSKRRNHDDVLNNLNELSTDSRLTYSQTLELVTIGFRALDPYIFDDINAYIPGPSERLADMVRENNVDEVAILLSENPFDTNMLNALLFIAASNASDHGSVVAMVAMLLAKDADGNHQDDYIGSTPLIEASANGDKIVVKKLLDVDGIDVNLANYDESTPLYEASSRGHESVVELLLPVVGIDVNPTVNVDDVDDDHMYEHDGAMWREYTPLLVAIMNGHEKVVGMLLAHPNIKVNQADRTGRTPLFLASELGQINTVISLIGIQLVISLIGIQLINPDNREELDVNQATWSSSGDGPTSSHTPLIVASSRGHEQVVRHLLFDSKRREEFYGPRSNQININHADDSCRTALYLASLHDHDKVVKLLLDAEGINVNIISDIAVYRTPLIAAIAAGHENVVKMLLAHPEIDINLVNYDGSTPLMGAIMNGHAKVVEMLLAKKGIDVNQADSTGRTPLFLVASELASELFVGY